MRRDVRVGSEEFRGGVSRLLSRERDRARVSSWLCLTDGSTAAARAAACALLDPSRAFIVPGDGRSSRSAPRVPAFPGSARVSQSRADSPGRLRGLAPTALRRSESGLTLQRAPRGARLLPRPHEIGGRLFPTFSAPAHSQKRGARRVSAYSPAVTLEEAPLARPASHTSGRAHVAMDEGETLPLLSATATAARASRDADGAPIRSAGLASCSGRGSTKKKTSRWLATLGAASLGALLLAGAAVGRGGLDGNLHFTSLGRGGQGRGAREAARGPRRRRGARVPRARGLERPRRHHPRAPGHRADAASGTDPAAAGARRGPSARAPRGAQARARRRARSRSRRRPSRGRGSRRTTRAAQLAMTKPSQRPRSSRATIRPRRRRTRPARSSTRSRGG